MYLPTLIQAWYRRGECSMKLKELDEAINDFYNVVRIEPTNQAAINHISECLEQKQSKEAMGAEGVMVSADAMFGAMKGALGTQMVEESIKNPSKLQKICNKKIPDFLSEYVKKYGKDDNEKVYELWSAYGSFCYTAADSLDEQVLSI